MTAMKKTLAKLDICKNPEERVIYQVMDLMMIKSKGIESGTMDKETAVNLDALVMDWIWLYSNGYNLSSNPRASMPISDALRYEAMMERFGRFQQFMQDNMNLTE